MVNGANCIIIHGCPSSPEGEIDIQTRSYDKHWIPWVREQLNERGVPTISPRMPDPWAPDYDAYRKEFEKYPISGKTILIGHSCGCAFLVRWLGDSKQKIDTLVLVAPWKIPKEGDTGRKAFYDYPIDETIKSRVRKIVMFTSDNDEEDGKRSLKIFHAALGGKIVNLHGKGHYIGQDMGNQEFPELLKELD